MRKIVIIAMVVMAMVLSVVACDDGASPPTNTQVRDAWVTLAGMNPARLIVHMGVKAPMCVGESVVAKATDNKISPACYEAGIKLMQEGKLPLVK